MHNPSKSNDKTSKRLFLARIKALRRERLELRLGLVRQSFQILLLQSVNAFLRLERRFWTWCLK